VQAKLREEIVARLEESIILAGAEDYDKGMQQFARMLEFVNRNFDPIRSKEQLRAVLDEIPDVSFLQARLFLGTAKYIPQIIRFSLKHLATASEDDLPPVPTGRPGLKLQEKTRIVDFVGNQHKSITSLDRCIKKAAERFRVSEATVQRAWDDRASLDPADFRSVLKFLEDGPPRK
jgi:hypothetical protein